MGQLRQRSRNSMSNRKFELDTELKVGVSCNENVQLVNVKDWQ